MRFVSYAQNFEDVMLWRALKHVEDGCYIDIGASDPVVDSVSLAFHERGWRGIHVEPLAVHAEALRAARPGDVVLQAALGENTGSTAFFIVDDGLAISTACQDIALGHAAAGFEIVRCDVACLRLSDLLDRHVQGDVHWMKIDVEGAEAEVIRSWAPSPVRPWIVVAESTRPMTQISSHAAWEPTLLGLGYRLVHFDGINRFYISEKHPELAEFFACGPNFFDNFVISRTSWMWSREPAKADDPPPAPSRRLRRSALRLLRIGAGPPLRAARRAIVRLPWLRAFLLRVLSRCPRLHAMISAVLGETPPLPPTSPADRPHRPSERADFAYALLRSERARLARQSSGR